MLHGRKGHYIVGSGLSYVTVTFASLLYFITLSRSRTIREARRGNKINQRDKCYGHVTLASAYIVTVHNESKLLRKSFIFMKSLMEMTLYLSNIY